MRLPPETLALVGKAPFARDPYAFVLYGRGGGRLQRQPGAAGASGPGARGADAFADDRPQGAGGAAVLGAGSPGARQAGAGTGGAEQRRWNAGRTTPRALRLLAGLDRAAGLPTARERYARLLALDPHDLEARRTYGELLAEAGLLTEAQRELETVLQRRPRRPARAPQPGAGAGRAPGGQGAVRRAGRGGAARPREHRRPHGSGRRLPQRRPGGRRRRRPTRRCCGGGRATPARSSWPPTWPASAGELERASTYYAKLRWLAPPIPARCS